MSGAKGTKVTRSPEEQPDRNEPELFPVKGYLILNAVFWAYCVLQILALRYIFRDVMGLLFFFFVLGVGFTLVSIYDCLYDRIACKWGRQPRKDNPGE